jgi:acetyltransferase-like isoleucine patch superfamily enzyme
MKLDMSSRAAKLADRLQSRLRVEACRRRYPNAVLGAHLGIRGRLIIKGSGKVVVGQHCFFDVATRQPNVLRTFTPAATITIGESCYLNGVEISSQASITIGNRCIIADCLILDTDFHSIEINRHDPSAVVKTGPVVIEDNVWIGNRTIILKGVRIGKNSVIGAGTVVRQSVPANSVVIGNPQQIVKTLTEPPSL